MKQRRTNSYIAPLGSISNRDHSLVCGDCRHILAAIPPESIALTHTSPPYNIGRGYRGFKDKQDIGEYSELLRGVMEQLFRVTKVGGSVFWQVGYTTVRRRNGDGIGGIVPLDSILLPIAQDAGFIVWDRIVWNYHGSMAFQSKFTNRHETILWLTKASGELKNGPFFNLDDVRERSKSYDSRNHLLGRNPGNVWYAERVAYGSTGQTSHIAVFPEEVSEKIVRACSSPGDLLLDPFAGSGTLPKVALTLGRRFIGSDLSEQYASEADERLRLWGASETENLAIGLLVKYGFHSRPGQESRKTLADVLDMHIGGSDLDRELCDLEAQVSQVLLAERVTKSVKAKKQELWQVYDEIIEAGDESQEILAADRALAFCYAHRSRWNGVRRYLSAASLLREAKKEIGSFGSTHEFVGNLISRATGRFRSEGRSVECLRVDPGLGCNGIARPPSRASTEKEVGEMLFKL